MARAGSSSSISCPRPPRSAASCRSPSIERPSPTRPGSSAMSLAEHGVGLANTRGRAEVDTEMAGRLDLAGGVRVHRRGVAPALAGTLGAGDHCLLGDLGGLPLHPITLVGGRRASSMR